MRSASTPLLKAIGERFAARFGNELPFKVNPNPQRQLPYGVLGGDTETDGFSTKALQGSVITHTIRIYTHEDAKSRAYASDAIEELTDTENPIVFEVDGGSVFYSAGRVHVDLNEIIDDRDERGDIYGAVIRFRFWIGQYKQ